MVPKPVVKRGLCGHSWQTDGQSNDQSGMPKPLQGAVARGFCWGDSVESSIKNAATTGERYVLCKIVEVSEQKWRFCTQQMTNLLTKSDGIPTVSWIGARGRKSQDYAIFLAELPEVAMKSVICV